MEKEKNTALKETQAAKNKIEFTQVSIEDFFDKEDMIKDSIQTGIIVLTKNQEELVNRLLEALKVNAPDRIERKARQGIYRRDSFDDVHSYGRRRVS